MNKREGEFVVADEDRCVWIECESGGETVFSLMEGYAVEAVVVVVVLE